MSVVTPLTPSADQQSEQRLREDLAAAFRLAVEFGWHEGVGNHFSAAVSEDGTKVPDEPQMAALFRSDSQQSPASGCQ
jgi:ribulose-5-phosphate 4-epimerase/fuculose-1-phosphate aldolase